jgi:(E)-4-hydroxy-3-methylbut-2-enyl-diphosphate synthase
MMINRRKTKAIKIGKLLIGANNPVAVQSMVKVCTKDIDAVLRQIGQLERQGCEIVRLAVRDPEEAKVIKRIKQVCRIPLVADIHFNWQLALLCIDNGIDKIRLNPGNIYRKKQVQEIARAAKSAKIPIRVGVNSGSLRNLQSSAYRPQSIKDKMINSALDYIKILEAAGFYDIVVSLKASDTFVTIEAYRKMAKLCSYPFHLGVTATGLPQAGAVKSSIALGVLLSEGIGDTIRVSLTDSPVQEVWIAKYILQSLGLRRFNPQIISCPTCGRCEVDLVKLVRDLEKRLSAISYQPSALPLTVAVMGCVVNGPGEAKEANLGLAFGKRDALMFKRGKPIKKVSLRDCADVLLEEVCKFISA